MNKGIRILIVFAGMAILVAVGLNGPAWADKLKASAQSPAANVPDQGLQAESRPQGTVITTPDCVETLTPGNFTIGSIAEWELDGVSGGNLYTACTVKDSELPAGLPAVLLTSPIQLAVSSGTSLGVPQKICFPLPPGKNGSAYFWDGTAWVKTEEAKDGKACVTPSAETHAPTFVVLFQEP